MSILPACAETPDMEDAPEQISMTFEEYMDLDTESGF